MDAALTEESPGEEANCFEFGPAPVMQHRPLAPETDKRPERVIAPSIKSENPEEVSWPVASMSPIVGSLLCLGILLPNPGKNNDPPKRSIHLSPQE